jgi:hypothetical protein
MDGDASDIGFEIGRALNRRRGDCFGGQGAPASKRGQAFQPGHGVVNRFMTAQSTVATGRWGGPSL